MSFVRIWVHLVFATKKRDPVLTKSIRDKVQKHIIENCEQKEIFLQAINGHNDHMHCLISLNRTQSIAEVARLIKGESAFWINQNNLIDGIFQWQDDYFAVSIGESQVEKVTQYIKNQEVHHAEKTFAEEEALFMKKYGWQKIKD